MLRWLHPLLALTVAWMANGVGAADALAAYPERPITLIVCFPAGGGSDIAARLVNVPLGEALGKPVIVENRAGAGGNVGITAAARATPDGYTLLLCSSAFVVNPNLYAHASYDPFKDLLPLMVLGASPNAIVTPAKSEFRTLGDVIKKAKAEPGKLNWTSSGVGTTPHLGGEVIKQRASIDMVHVPFQGSGPATTAVVAGQVDLFMANISSVTQLIEGGQVRPLAITAPQRWPALRDVPTLEEAGISGANTDSWQGIWAPAGTPQAIVDILAKALADVMSKDDMKGKFDKIGLPAVAEGPSAFRERIVREVAMYKTIIEAAGLKVR